MHSNIWHIVGFRKIISFKIGIKKYTKLFEKTKLTLNDFLKKISLYCAYSVFKLIYYSFFFFFKLPFPFFAIRLLRYLSVGRFSNSFSLFLCLSVMRRGSGALSPATHAHSTSHSQTYTTTFIHPYPSRRDSNPC
jgi:hypothetical protein